MDQTKEKQYQIMVEMQEAKGSVPMSLRGSLMWRIDPKLLVFTLSRHKFVAKIAFLPEALYSRRKFPPKTNFVFM